MYNKFTLEVLQATNLNTEKLGTLFTEGAPSEVIAIDHYHYGDSVVDGKAIPINHSDSLIARSAYIKKRSGEVNWLERHSHMNQLFVGLGSKPYGLVLAPPTSTSPSDHTALPKIEELKCYIFPAGSAILLHRGTWHDFPMAIQDDTTVMTIVSNAVVETLKHQTEPAELNENDILKLDLPRYYGKTPCVQL